MVSIETLDGLIKHNEPLLNTDKLNSILGKDFFKNKINFRKSPSLEAQIASISDDIAYNSHDLEDGLKAKLFNIDDVKEIPVLSEIIKKNLKRGKKQKLEIILSHIIRDTINEMVTDIISNTKRNLKKYKIYDVNKVYNHPLSVVTFSNKMMKFDKDIKEFSKKMYYSKTVLKKTNEGKK